MSEVTTVTPFLELDGVAIGFGPEKTRTDILRDVNLEVGENEFVAIIGFSGSGKSTLVSLLAGLERPTEGEVRMEGVEVTRPGPRRGVMFQSYSLLPWLSVFGNIELAVKQVFPSSSSVEVRKHVDRYIEMVNLADARDKAPHELSGGMRQRVSLARTLAMQPDVLLLDEPLSALDEYLRLQMRAEVKKLQLDLGITFIHVTHTQPEALALADLVVVMDTGHIEQSGTARSIYDDPRTTYVAEFMGGWNVLSGQVLSDNENLSTVKSPYGEEFHVPKNGHNKGEDLSFGVRRDKIHLLGSGDQKDRGNSLNGKVHAIEYQGNWVKVTIDRSDTEQLVAVIEDKEYFSNPANVGDQVTATWSASDVHFMERAEGEQNLIGETF